MLWRVVSRSDPIDLGRLEQQDATQSYPPASGSFCSAIFANRQVHSRLRGATPSNCTPAGTQRSGMLVATSLISTRHPARGRSVSRSVIRAVAAGRTFASRTSSSPGTQLCTTVSSSITAGHVPMECRMRVPGAGHVESTARIRLFPTTQPEYVHPLANTSQTRWRVAAMSRVTVMITSPSRADKDLPVSIDGKGLPATEEKTHAKLLRVDSASEGSVWCVVRSEQILLRKRRPDPFEGVFLKSRQNAALHRLFARRSTYSHSPM
jgi:hypothetical protein